MTYTTDKLPEGMRHNWNFRSWKENDIKDRLPEVLNQIQTLYDKAGGADMGNLTFDTFLQPILQAQRLTFGNYWWYGTLGSPIVFPKLVGVNKEVRDAATEAGKAIDDLTLEMFMRKDVFERMIEFRKICDIDPEYVRFVDRMITVGKSNGLQLEAEQQDKVKVLKTEINTLVGEFEKRLIEDKTVVLLNEIDLAGLSEDFIKGLEVDAETGLKKLTMSYPTYLPVMRKCRIPDTRRKMVLAYNNRGGTRNEEIMQRVIELRHECAKLLGYKTWAALRQEENMAKNPETVDSFLMTLSSKLQPLWKEEREALLKLKEEECKKYGYEFNGELDMWDLSYYCNMIEEKDYCIDTEKLKEYFPLETVTNGLLGVYSHILGLEFTKLVDPPAWHEDVFAYKVNDKQSGELMGYVYMDLFPREGKHSHFYIKPMQSGSVNEAGVKEKTVTCMVCNFNPPSQGKPSLLTPNEVKTYFHEFGHAMHTICSKAKVQMFWGTHVERDFVEAPSQMLENWVKEKEVLARISGHYLTGETIPDVEVDKLKKADKANVGYFNLWQIALATFDQRIHQSGSIDPRKAYSDVTFEILGMRPHPDTFFPGTFEHVMHSYDAGYYSYMWSEVFSVDMYETVFGKVGPLDANAGMKYRQMILEKGGSVDGFDMLRNILGREPNQEAFLMKKGLI
ncbi:thimet oligopeptidase-like isoform X1 [Bradysia coprophila]|nr:thimet oligopeptidase-like isoform X1 [Bradysia coprophila]